MSEPRGKNPESDRRDDRRAKALRENLKRRKVQARGRAAAGDDDAGPRDSGKTGPQNGDSRGD
jgi:hypothetical protein